MSEEDELAAIRARRAAQVEQQHAVDSFYQDQQSQLDAQRQAVLRQILTPEARERLGSLRTARPQVAAAVESQLIALAQAGRIRMVDDATLRQILAAVTPKRREITITRR